jgi:hypothetical protein
MADYRRRVMAVYSHKWARYIKLTLPDGIEAESCDIHYIDSETFRDSPIGKRLAASQREDDGQYLRDDLKRQTIFKLLRNSEVHPIPMPHGHGFGQHETDGIVFSSKNIAIIFTYFDLGLERFPLCIERNRADPDIISGIINAFRPHEPATEWEINSDQPIIYRDGFRYETTDCYTLDFLARFYNSALSDYPNLIKERDRLRAAISKSKPDDYESTLAFAIRLRESGIDPALMPGMRWNAPDTVAYIKLLKEERTATLKLKNLEKVETCRRYVHLLEGIGDLSIHLPNPYNWDAHLAMLNEIKPRLEAERDDPQGSPIELVRRFSCLNGRKTERYSENARFDDIYAGARLDAIWEQAADETIASIDAVLTPLAHAINNNKKARMYAERLLDQAAKNSLNQYAEKRGAGLSSSSMAFFAGLRTLDFNTHPHP